jgi:hypothetical protein
MEIWEVVCIFFVTLVTVKLFLYLVGLRNSAILKSKSKGWKLKNRG